MNRTLIWPVVEALVVSHHQKHRNVLVYEKSDRGSVCWVGRACCAVPPALLIFVPFLETTQPYHCLCWILFTSWHFFSFFRRFKNIASIRVCVLILILFLCLGPLLHISLRGTTVIHLKPWLCWSRSVFFWESSAGLLLLEWLPV